ncbi:MAG: hypothetical protein RJB66_1689 [Pseudomonadota bacterium]|jgi:anti-sigma factor ChrR (cupin superfamily)
MKNFNLNAMVKGWFIGNFTPAVVRDDRFEVAVKYYQAGDKESAHHHKVAYEITCVAEGKVRMNGKVFVGGDIIYLEPNEVSDFEVLEKTITVVVKAPSVAGDKYLEGNND